jgi:hypothetical protein
MAETTQPEVVVNRTGKGDRGPTPFDKRWPSNDHTVYQVYGGPGDNSDYANQFLNKKPMAASPYDPQGNLIVTPAPFPSDRSGENAKALTVPSQYDRLGTTPILASDAFRPTVPSGSETRPAADRGVPTLAESTRDVTATSARDKAVEQARNAFTQPSTVSEKLKAIDDLAQAGETKLTIPDQNGVAKDYRIERSDLGDGRALVHMFAPPDQSGKENIAFRAISDGDGHYEQQRDAGGSPVEFRGSNWSEKEARQSGIADDTREENPQAAPSARTRPPRTEPGDAETRHERRRHRREAPRKEEPSEPQAGRPPRTGSRTERPVQTQPQSTETAEQVEKRYADINETNNKAGKFLHKTLDEYQAANPGQPMTKENIDALLAQNKLDANSPTAKNLGYLSKNWEKAKEFTVDGKGQEITGGSIDQHVKELASNVADAKQEDLDKIAHRTEARRDRTSVSKNPTADATHILDEYDRKLQPDQTVRSDLRRAMALTHTSELTQEGLEQAIHSGKFSRANLRQLQKVDTNWGHYQPFSEGGTGDKITPDSLDSAISARREPIIAERTAKLVEKGLVDPNTPAHEVPIPARPLNQRYQTYTTGYYSHNDTVQGGFFDMKSGNRPEDLHYLGSLQDFLESKPGLDGKVPTQIAVAAPDWIPYGQRMSIKALTDKYRDQLDAKNKRDGTNYTELPFVKVDRGGAVQSHIDLNVRTKWDAYALTTRRRDGDKPYDAMLVPKFAWE